MIPKLGQHVKCILRNGAVAEGIVQSDWMNSVVQLLSLDGKSVIIIPHPAEDIMLIKIVLDEAKTPAETVAEHTELEKKFEEAREATDPHDTDSLRSLADLKIELIKQERKIIADKLKDHRPGSAYDLSRRTKLAYGYPGFIKKPSPK